MTVPADESASGAAVDSVEVRPPRGPAEVMGVVAAGSAVMAGAGIATGAVLLGVVALVSVAWLASLTYVSLTGWARADGDGVAVRWVRSTVAVRWAEAASVEVDRGGPHGALRGVEVVRHDGAAARWAPWYPFLWYAHRSVAASVDELTTLAGEHGVPVSVVTAPPPAPRTPGPSPRS